jgi:hypothetical protein
LQLYRLTFWTRFSDKVRIDIGSQGIPTQNETGVCNVAFTDSTDGLNTSVNNRNSNFHIKDNTNDESDNMKWLYTICCMSSKNNNYDVSIEDAIIEEAKLSIEEEAKKAALAAREDPKWQAICDGAAIILIAVGAFFWGLYA